MTHSDVFFFQIYEVQQFTQKIKADTWDRKIDKTNTACKEISSCGLETSMIAIPHFLPATEQKGVCSFMSFQCSNWQSIHCLQARCGMEIIYKQNCLKGSMTWKNTLCEQFNGCQ
jgi:hypothetical protein